METNNLDDDLKALLSGGSKTDSPEDYESGRVDSALKRAKESLAQRETLGFVLIKLWATIARIFAPLFAQVAKRHAHNAAYFQQGTTDLKGDRQ